MEEVLEREERSPEVEGDMIWKGLSLSSLSVAEFAKESIGAAVLATSRRREYLDKTCSLHEPALLKNMEERDEKKEELRFVIFQTSDFYIILKFQIS